MVRPLSNVIDVLQNLLKNVVLSYYIVEQMCHLLFHIFIMYDMSCTPPATPTKHQGLQPMVINWTPTAEHIPCQAQPGHAHGPWSPPCDF